MKNDLRIIGFVNKPFMYSYTVKGHLKVKCNPIKLQKLIVKLQKSTVHNRKLPFK